MKIHGSDHGRAAAGGMSAAARARVTREIIEAWFRRAVPGAVFGTAFARNKGAAIGVRGCGTPAKIHANFLEDL